MSLKHNRSFVFGVVTGFVTAAILLTIVLPLFRKSSVILKHSTNRPLIIAYGDSITQRGNNGWIGLLGDWYTRKADILNRGFSGYNSRWGIQMFREVILVNQPDLLIIFFGANDAVVPEVLQHVPLDEYTQNIEAMIQLLLSKQPNAKVIIISPPPIFEKDLEMSNSAKGKAILLDRSNRRTMLYANACKDLSRKYNTGIVDAWTGLGGDSVERQSYLMDGLHFNDNGNKKLFDLLQVTITKTFPEWIPENMKFHQKQWFEYK